MNRKTFLKTGILSTLLGFFIPQVKAKSAPPSPISLTKKEKEILDEKWDKINQIDPNLQLLLLTHLSVWLPENDKSFLPKKHLEKIGIIKPSLFTLEGSIEKIISYLHHNLLIILARAISQHKDYKYLNLDNLQLYHQLVDKYKISNINIS